MALDAVNVGEPAETDAQMASGANPSAGGEPSGTPDAASPLRLYDQDRIRTAPGSVLTADYLPAPSVTSTS